ncbi:hypothetical protein [Streptomyces sp. NPDC127072]|uniref:hypothetical protein n=1 Tax=Streptomyces sp. NPDC127072 TaxID=3347129 RepID=UPI0036680DFC
MGGDIIGARPGAGAVRLFGGGPTASPESVDDTLSGGAGVNALTAGRWRLLRRGSEADAPTAGPGHDTLAGDDSPHTAVGGDGNDVVDGTPGVGSDDCTDGPRDRVGNCP